MATNTIQTFTSHDFGTIRTVEHDGTVLFCSRDVAVASGYENPSKAIRDHCKGVSLWWLSSSCRDSGLV